MDTNIVTITNMVFVVSTNPVPVTFAGYDYATCQAAYLNGFAYGFPAALVLCIIWLIVRSMKNPGFPSND